MSQITGLKSVRDMIAGIKRRKIAGLKRGLGKAALFLLRESQQLVPVETGNLKGSAFVRSTGTTSRPEYTIGYTAAYAVFVHEDLDAAHGAEFNRKYAVQIARAQSRKRKRERRVKGHRTRYFLRGEKQQAKFLESAYRRSEIALGIIIRDEVERA